MKKKTVALLLAVVLVLGCGIGGTLAWLIASTDKVVNTFTTSNIDITLSETDTNIDGDKNPNTNQYKMIPGHTIDKNPEVTVLKDSEPCYLFIKVEETAGTDSEGNTLEFDDYLVYNVDSDQDVDESKWVSLFDENGNKIPNVFYRIVKNTDDQNPLFENKSFDIIGYTYKDNAGTDVFVPNKMYVKDTVTKDMMEKIHTLPTLTLTAYASQLYKTNDVEFEPLEAWQIVQAEITP